VQRLNLLKWAPVVLVLTASCSSIKVGEPGRSGLLASQTRPFNAKLDPMRLHTEGNKVLDAGGKPVWLYGINIASLEWTNGGEHVEESVNRAINDWKVNLIRLPLAQDRWFGKMTNQTDGGAAYRALVDKLVDTCAAGRVYINLDLHWSDCGKWVNEGGKLGQHDMPDERSIDFWRDGGTAADKPARWNPSQAKVTYEAVGLQKLYDTVRATGATNLVTVSGLDWGYDLSGVLQGYEIKGSNLIYETHPYPNKPPNWDKNFGDASSKYPVYAGEWGFGRRDTNGLEYAQNLMQYAKKHELHWTAWDLHTTAGPTLIKNWQYEPTIFGQFVKEQLAALAAARGSNK
jgi:hypothetical protein